MIFLFFYFDASHYTSAGPSVRLRPPVYSPVHPSVRASLPLSVHPSVIRPCVRAYFHPGVRPSARLSVRAYLRPYVCPSVLLSVLSVHRPFYAVLAFGGAVFSGRCATIISAPALFFRLLRSTRMMEALWRAKGNTGEGGREEREEAEVGEMLHWY